MYEIASIYLIVLAVVELPVLSCTRRTISYYNIHFFFFLETPPARRPTKATTTNLYTIIYTCTNISTTTTDHHTTICFCHVTEEQTYTPNPNHPKPKFDVSFFGCLVVLAGVRGLYWLVVYAQVTLRHEIFCVC